MKEVGMRRESPRLKKHKIRGGGDDIVKTDDDSDFEVYREKKKCKVAIEMKSDNVIAGDRSIYLCSRFLKMWSFYYDEHNRNFHGKATYWNDFKVPETIMHKLSETQHDMFMRTPFSQYLKFETPKMYSQIIHQALIREIHQRDDAEIWFELGEKRVRFGLPEFCLITGLKGIGNVDASVFSGMNSILIDKYFGDCRVTRALIDSVYKSVAFVDDEEAVRMSVIYMLFNFLLAAAPPRFVDRGLLCIPTLMDRGICTRTDDTNLRILSWKETGKPPTNEQLNDFVFGSGQMRVQFISPTLEELKVMKFLECFRFLESNSVGNGVDHDIGSKPKKVFVGASFRSPEFKKVIDDRIKPLEESISSVKESIENLRKDFTNQLIVLQEKILSEMTILLKGEDCGKGSVEVCGRSDSIVGEFLKKEGLDHVSGESLKSYNNDFVNETPVCTGNVNPSTFCAVDDVVGVSVVKICKVNRP
ncbi:hypothetical protein OROGR_022354 [Orobanche gracilis]